MFSNYAHDIYIDASNTAKRAGDVLVRTHEGMLPGTPTPPRDTLQDELEAVVAYHSESSGYTEFLYEPAIKPQLIPAAPKYHDSEWVLDGRAALIDNRSVADELQSRYIDPVHGIVATVGSMAVMAGGIELANHNTFYDVAGIATGGVMAWAYTAVQELRSLRATKKDIRAIQKQLIESDQIIRLPNYSPVHYITPEDMQVLQATDVPIAGTQAATLRGDDILTWLEFKIAGDKLERVRYSYAPSPYHSVGASVLRDTSLWEVYYAGSSDMRLESGESIHRKAQDFVSLRDELSQKLKLKLTKAKPKLDDMVFLGLDTHKLDEEFRNNWQDAKVSFVQLPPGIVVERLLRKDFDPTSLWQQIAPDLVTLHDDTINHAVFSDQLRAITRRAAHTGVTNPEDEIAAQQLRLHLAELEQNMLMTTLSVVGAAVIRDREQRYDSVRQELAESIGQTARAKDQFDAIKLFDIAINALAQKLDPDSEEAIKTAHQLKNYLIDSVPHFNGTESAYRQLYQGMQKRFPQLQLS